MRAGIVVAWATAVVVTALYIYTVVAAIGNMIGMASFLGSALSPAAWIALGAGVVMPAIIYVVALLVGRGRSAGMRILILVTGLCVAAVIQLDMLHLMG